ncbi:Cyclin-t1-4 [Thalictrum thalictroides]|uniref:Cyclin-t1-4 n=1 Tax=Thalictrum thalictroides TaxID=46969 RepID=A0A7J6WGZ0_THATH|nr:Cyclin-t1-4 [Thalictrum thalictroides]
MEGPEGVSFQHVITRNATNVIYQDPLDELEHLRPRWYLSRRELEDNSPSRKDGIAFKKETQLRSLYCSFLQDLGMKLKVPQVTIATAMMFIHRFYLHQSHAKNDWQTIATVSMFLASKVEETPRLLVDVIVVAYEMIHRRDPSAPQRIKQKDVYEKQKELVLIAERLLLVTIGFDFNIQHPYKPLVAALKKLDISQNDVARVAWNFVNDWLRTSLCLQYKPHYIAAGSMYLAAKFCKVKLPSEKEKVWWLEFDVSPHQLEEVIKKMLKVLEENKRQPVPSSSDKATKAAVVKKATPSNQQSCTLSPCKATCELTKEIQEETGKNDNSKQSSNTCRHNSQTVQSEDVSVVQSEDISVVRNVETLQCQTSDCGSSQSAVEDGNRTDEGEVQAVKVECSQTGACKIVSDCGGLSKIDKDRIKETLRKRKYEKAANKKVVTTLGDDKDDDLWIVRELENGIEMGSAAGKRQRLCVT